MMPNPKSLASKRGAKKGQNRFAKFQDSRQEFIVSRLQLVIRKIQQHGAAFDSVTQLAAFVSTDLKSNKDPVEVSPSTLLRNSSYRLLLDAIVDIPVTKSEVRSSVERAHLEIEIQELQAENRRYRLALEKSLSSAAPTTEMAPAQKTSSEIQKLTDLYEIIEALLQASEGLVIADHGSKSIVRSWARTVRHKTIVDTATASTYFELKANILKSTTTSSH